MVLCLVDTSWKPNPGFYDVNQLIINDLTKN